MNLAQLYAYFFAAPKVPGGGGPALEGTGKAPAGFALGWRTVAIGGLANK